MNDSDKEIFKNTVLFGVPLTDKDVNEAIPVVVCAGVLIILIILLVGFCVRGCENKVPDKIILKSSYTHEVR